jgi:hypothetical protein
MSILLLLNTHRANLTKLLHRHLHTIIIVNPHQLPLPQAIMSQAIMNQAIVMNQHQHPLISIMKLQSLLHTILVFTHLQVIILMKSPLHPITTTPRHLMSLLITITRLPHTTITRLPLHTIMRHPPTIIMKLLLSSQLQSLTIPLHHTFPTTMKPLPSSQPFLMNLAFLTTTRQLPSSQHLANQQSYHRQLHMFPLQSITGHQYHQVLSLLNHLADVDVERRT